MSNRNLATELAKKYNIMVSQKRYSHNGKWYHHLTKFPAAFMDAHGSIIFKTQIEYNNCQYLNRGQDVNVRGQGISSIPGYERFQERSPRQISEMSSVHLPVSSIQQNQINTVEFTEGAVEEMTIELKKRDARLRFLAVQNLGTVCQACGFDFEKIYGDLGNGYIEVHHITPLSLVTGVHTLTIADVNVVCANCHRMLHRKGRNAISIQELKDLIRKRD